MIGRADILSARILVVDDAAVNVILLERMLRGAGYTAVTTTTNPRKVFDLHREHDFDLILLDLLMPGMDGFRVMQDLKALEPDGYLPVLVLTAQAEHKVQALKAGAKDFISKPLDQVEVLTRIHNMLEVRLLLREAKNYGRLLEQYDQVTGLPNRTCFRDLLVRALDAAPDRADIVSVLIVSIDRFANVSDAMGRQTAEAVLRRVGQRLAGCTGPMDRIARFEGGVFGILVAVPGGGAHGGGLVASTIRGVLRPALGLEDVDVAVTASIGIAVSPGDAQDAETLMMLADRALHESADAGGDTYRYYSSAMNVRTRETLELETAMRHALERDEFVLHYQPKLRVDSGEWSGVEALLRWERPGHGLIQPSAFIPVLEETGMIVPVGAWVINAVCRQIGEWTRSGVGPVRVAVNVSGKQFLRDGFVAEIARAIRDTGIAPDLLDIEITESSLMSRRADTDRVLRELKQLGVSIAIDDFGTGYSSLAYLHRFPIDTLKIDISFIRELTTSPDGAAIAVAIINMARSLKMTVIAEGVETEAQLAFLRQHACDEIQGYYCSRPVPASDLAALRARRYATPAQATEVMA